MKKAILLRECFMGGPGLSGYAYAADVYCPGCARGIVKAFTPEQCAAVGDVDDPAFQDSEMVPQPIFFGESDCAQHCADCGEYLYGPADSSES